MISASDLELRAGARLLLDQVNFQVAAGDKIGLVGRNGAGKTTLLRVLAGEGQRRRVELARILFGGARTLLLDEPTNHLDADSVTWLRDHLRSYRGGLIVISHDTDLLEAIVGKVFHLDADRAELDIYNVGWKAYLDQRETDARRRRRERVNAEPQAARPH